MYRILKFDFKDIVKCNYSVTENDGEWVLEQDNQMFRQIRLTTGDCGKTNWYIFFMSAKGAKQNKDELLEILNNGIQFNGHTYYAAERSASMVRQAVFSFVRDDIYDQLHEIVGNGINLKETVISKYMAYRALLMSSCFCLENFYPKVIVVSDYYTTVKDQHIRYLKTVEKQYTDANTGEVKHYKQEELCDGTTDVEICPADGAGVVHPIVAQQIRNLLQRDKKTCRGTSFMLRAPFIKGVVHEVDYTQFLEDRGVEWITDLWGQQHSIYEPMIILTKSQYKCYGFYKKYDDIRDYETYWYNFKKYNHCLGIAKWNYNAEDEPIYTRCNYQVLQTLDAPVEDFLELADYSRHWAEKIMDGDTIYTNCFLGMYADHAKPSNAFCKAMMKDPRMVNEKSVRRYLQRQLRKYIDQMKCGKIYLKSTFRIIAPDLIALMEHIGGLEPVGCLEADECWSQGVNGANLGRKLLTRNPHISRTENVVLNGVCPDVVNQYLSHLQGITMVNGKSIVLQRWNGADTDGDLLLEFDDPRLLDWIDNTLPPAIDLEDKKPALSEPFNRDSINAYILRTLDNRIGEYSNIATCYHNKNWEASKDPQAALRRYNDYIDFISILNGREIDSAKTGVKYNVPRYIQKYYRPFPVFMKYAGKYYAKGDVFNKSMHSNMNRLCFEIESWAKTVRFTRMKKSDFDWHIMIDESQNYSEATYQKIKALHKEFTKEMAEHAKFDKLNQMKALSDYGYNCDSFSFVLDYGYYYRQYQEKATAICGNIAELTNYCVKSCYENKAWNPKFMWAVVEDGIVKNLKQQKLELPKRSDVGTEYLGRKYELQEV